MEQSELSKLAESGELRTILVRSGAIAPLARRARIISVDAAADTVEIRFVKTGEIVVAPTRNVIDAEAAKQGLGRNSRFMRLLDWFDFIP